MFAIADVETGSTNTLIQLVCHINGSCVKYLGLVYVICTCRWIGVAYEGIGAWVGGFCYGFDQVNNALVCDMFHGG